MLTVADCLDPWAEAVLVYAREKGKLAMHVVLDPAIADTATEVHFYPTRGEPGTRRKANEEATAPRKRERPD